MTAHSGKQLQLHPTRMGRVVFLAMEEILGQGGGNTVLHLAALPENINDYPPHDQDMKSSFMDISHLQAGLESAYGPRVGHGLALRVGRACLKYGLREFGPELGLNNQNFRLLPLQAKLKTGTEAFAALFNTYTDQHVRLEMDQKYIYWHMERGPLCWGGQAVGSCTHLAVGMLQEGLFWVSGGKFFEVEETKCIADGNGACIIRIDRTPMS